MHVSFISYGERSCVERMFRDMESQKHLMPMTKGKKKQSVWLNGQIRLLPFGVYEYIFPKESLDIVLNTLQEANTKHGINFKAPIYALLRAGLKLKKIPKYDTEQKYQWSKLFVSIVVLGIREDDEIIGSYIDDLGWTHEGL